nr:hypothetical protein [Prevotella sp.]
MKKKLQNKIAESRFALPISVLYGILILGVTDVRVMTHWFQFICICVATYLMAILNKNNALIRIFTNMVSSFFLVLVVMSNFLLSDYKIGIFAICVISFLLVFFNSYQQRNASGVIFYAFTCLGIASVIWIQILYFVPILWILMGNNLQNFSIRTFFSSLLGLMVLYWLIAGYYVYNNDLPTLLYHFVSITNIGKTFDYSNITNHDAISFLFVILLFITGTIHFFRHSFNDKIRVRLLFESFITIDISSIILIALIPIHFNFLFMILIINTVPLIAHYVTLTHTKVTNISFIIILLTILFITFYNIWTPEVHF